MSEDVRIEILVALFQWTEKLKYLLCHTSRDKVLGKSMNAESSMEKIEKALEFFWEFNRKIIYKSDQEKIVKEIDLINKEFKLPKRFRKGTGSPQDMKEVLSINVCEIGERLADKTRLDRGYSVDVNGNTVYQIVINTKGLRFFMPKMGIDVSLKYMLALSSMKGSTAYYISEPIVVRKLSDQSEESGSDNVENVDREITYSFTSDWLKKQMKQSGLNEGGTSGSKKDLLNNVNILCWVFTTGEDLVRALARKNPAAKINHLPNIQIPLYYGTNPALLFPTDSLKTNTRVELHEINVDISGKVEPSKGRSHSMGNELSTNTTQMLLCQ